jgi:hypothetical protein
VQTRRARCGSFQRWFRVLSLFATAFGHRGKVLSPGIG